MKRNGASSQGPGGEAGGGGAGAGMLPPALPQPLPRCPINHAGSGAARVLTKSCKQVGRRQRSRPAAPGLRKLGGDEGGQMSRRRSRGRVGPEKMPASLQSSGSTDGASLAAVALPVW